MSYLCIRKRTHRYLVHKTNLKTLMSNPQKPTFTLWELSTTIPPGEKSSTSSSPSLRPSSPPSEHRAVCRETHPNMSARRTGECSPPEAQKHIKCFFWRPRSPCKGGDVGWNYRNNQNTQITQNTLAEHYTLHYTISAPLISSYILLYPLMSSLIANL